MQLKRVYDFQIKMAKVIDLKRKINSLVKKSKVTDGGFSYFYINSDFECVGRKGIVEYIKDNHGEVYNDLKQGFQDKSEKDFLSLMSKLVMNVPFSDQDSKLQEKQNKVENVVPEVKKPEEEEEPVIKSYPLTLEFMRTIDGRTTRIPNYGSLAGRIARLIAMVISKKTEGDSVELTCHKCDKRIEGYKDIFTHMENCHSEFLENLLTMFPPAKNRMEQFIIKAAENFDLEVPTWEQVEKLQRQEKEKQIEIEKIQMEKKLEEARQARAELKAKREEAEKQRLAMKRKQEEEAKVQEFKKMKINPNDENALEKLKCKQEIMKIEKSLKEKLTENRKSQLTLRLNELKDKVKKLRLETKGKVINQRMETCLENLSPKQQRKLLLEYFKKIENDDDSISWIDICESVKIGDDYEFLTDFLCALYDLANFHEKKSFKVGTILVNSNQSASIKEKGVVSVRDFVKKNSWRIPSSWDFDIPDEDLGEDWSRKDDSRLLIGASIFGKNLSKILAKYPSMAAKAQDKLPSVKRRFGYLLNIYMNRGQPVIEFGNTLYSVDIEEECGTWEDEEEEGESDEEIVEVLKDDLVDDKSETENGHYDIKNNSSKEESVEEDDEEEIEELEEIEEIEDTEDVEEVENEEEVKELSEEEC